MGRGPLSSARQISSNLVKCSSNARQISSKFAPALCQICQYVKTAPSSGPPVALWCPSNRPKPLTSELYKIGQKWQEFCSHCSANTVLVEYPLNSHARVRARAPPPRPLRRTRHAGRCTLGPPVKFRQITATHRAPCQNPSNSGVPSGPCQIPSNSVKTALKHGPRSGPY